MFMPHDGLWGYGWVIWKSWNVKLCYFGMGDIFSSCMCLYIVHSSPYLCVCGDDRIIFYPRADDLTGEPGDT